MLPIFFWHTIKSVRQSKKAPGLLHSSVDRDGWLMYWTVTVWKSKKSMMEYRNQGNHLKAMKISRKVAKKIEYINWDAESIPSREECKKRLKNKFAEPVD